MKVIKYHSDRGHVVGLLVREGYKYNHYIFMLANGITVKRLPVSESQHIIELEYPVTRAVRRFRAAGKRFGITKAAKQILNEAKR